MAPSSLLLTVFGAVAAAQQLAGRNINFFNTEGCSLSGDYIGFPMGSGYPSCGMNTFQSDAFPVNGNGMVDVWVQFPQVPDGCTVYIRDVEQEDPAHPKTPNCGYPKITSTTGSCLKTSVAPTFDINFCCGTDCAAALNSRKTVRDLNEPLSRAHPKEIFAKRADCKWNPDGPTYRTDGPVQEVVSDASCTSTLEECSYMQTFTSETSFSNSVGVSVSAEAGFFDIVSVSTTFSYDFTYEQSHSVSQSRSVTIGAGQNGVLNFYPLLECSDGDLSGGDCPGTTGQKGSACVPVMNGDTPQGRLQFLQMG